MHKRIFARAALPFALVLAVDVRMALAAEEATRAGEVIVVTASRAPSVRRELIGDVSVVTREEIEQAGAASLADLLRTLPGIEIARNGGAGKDTSLFLRGTNASHVVVLIDGVRVGSATNGTTAIQHLPAALIERIEVLRGPASSLYGSEAIGGVVQIFTRRSSAPEFHADLGVGSHRLASADVGGTLVSGPLRLSADAGHAYERGESAIGNPSATAYNPDRDGYRNSHASVNATLALPGTSEAGLRHTQTDSRNWFDSGGATPLANPTRNFDFRGDQTLTTTSIHLRSEPVAGWTTFLRAGRGEDDLTSYGRSSTANTVSRFRTQQDQGTWQNDLRLGTGTLTAGLETVRQKIASTTAYQQTERNVGSAFAGWRGALDAHLLQVNARHDRNSQFGSRNTGYAGWAWLFAPGWQGSLAAGTAFNAPTFNQLYFPGFGRPDLQPETARNVEAGLRYAGTGLEVSAVAYRNRVRNLIANVRISPSIVQAQNVARARLEGVTVDTRASVGDWQLRASLDVQSPRDEATDKLLVRRAQRHATLGANTAIAGWELGGELLASSARYSDVDNRQRMGGYGVVNLTAMKPLDASWSVRLRADNVFGKHYELIPDFTTPAATLFAGLHYRSR